MRHLASKLREGRAVTDSEFDRVLPRAAREVAAAFWTPVSVARRAAELLVHNRRSKVLDIGSGVGKFCIVGAASTGSSFVGVEHREHFVLTARAAARKIGVISALFVHSTVDAINPRDFEAIYLFNPFEENLLSPTGHLDETVELSARRFAADVALAQSVLTRARAGTLVATYHGFGGPMPLGYRRVLKERHPSGVLELWVKTRRTAAPIRRPAEDIPRFLTG
jgi:hypothetical protein